MVSVLLLPFLRKWSVKEFCYMFLVLFYVVFLTDKGADGLARDSDVLFVVCGWRNGAKLVEK